MSVELQDQRKVYDGNGTATSFAFPFTLEDGSQVEVVVADADGVETTLTYGTDYTVTFDTPPSGIVQSKGSVNLPTPLPVGYKIALMSNILEDQQRTFPNNTPYYQEQVEGGIDKNTRLIQQLSESVKRAALAPVTSGKTGAEFFADLKGELEDIRDAAEDAKDAAEDAKDDAFVYRGSAQEAAVIAQNSATAAQATLNQVRTETIGKIDNVMIKGWFTVWDAIAEGESETISIHSDYKVGAYSLMLFDKDGNYLIPKSVDNDNGVYDEDGTVGEVSNFITLYGPVSADTRYYYQIIGLNAASLVDDNTVKWDAENGISVDPEAVLGDVEDLIQEKVEEDVAELLDDEYQKVNTQEWNSALDYEKGALVTGSDGNLYVALQPSGPGTVVVDPVGDASGVWAHVVDPADKYKNILDKFRIAGTYTRSSSAPGTQGFTIDTKRHKFIAGNNNSSDTYQELQVLDPSSLSDSSRFWDSTNKWAKSDVCDLTELTVDATHTFSTLGHVNSLCYLPDTDEIYVMPLIKDGNNNIVIKVLDASDYSEKSDLSVVPTTNVGQFALAYDTIRNRFVMGRPCTINSSGTIVSTPTYIVNGNVVNNSALYNAFWIRICKRDLSTIDEFIVRVPDGKVFGEGNGIGCHDGILIASTFNAVSVYDLDKKSIIGFYETHVNALEIEDFEFDENGNLFCHFPQGRIAQFSNVVCDRISLGAYNSKKAFFHPSNAGSVDLNDMTDPGVYVINTESNPSDTNMTPTILSNAPGGATNGLLKVESGGNIIKQFWSRWGTLNSNDYQNYMRSCINGSWGNWHKYHMSDEVITKAGKLAQSGTTTDDIYILAGSQFSDGAGLYLYPKAHTTRPSWLMMQTNVSGTYYTITLTGTTFIPSPTKAIDLGTTNNRWKTIWQQDGAVSGSDERIKAAIASIPDSVLDAWGDVQWQQYKLRASIAEKGETNARLHTGVIAQRIGEAFTAHGLDAGDYGLFCHDEWNAKDAEYDENGGVIVPGLEAGDSYSIRYDEALCMEAAYQRRRAARAEARLSALEQRLNELEQVLAALGSSN